VTYKKIICVGFDGTLHSYSSGWQGARTIPDPPVPGAIEWLTELLEEHCDMPDSVSPYAPPGEIDLCIFSSRSRCWGGKRAIKRWLVKHGLDPVYLEVLRFPRMKPFAHVFIDSRAITFTGTFPTIEEMLEFRPWNKP